MELHHHLWRMTTAISATALYGLYRKNDLYVLDLLQLSLALTNDILTNRNITIESPIWKHNYEQYQLSRFSYLWIFLCTTILPYDRMYEYHMQWIIGNTEQNLLQTQL